VTSKERSAPNEEEQQTLGVREVIGSIMAAGLGVQSQANRERDFKRGKAWQYVVAGLLATLVFILSVFGVVQLVLGLTSQG
jgi:hypothetical protein